MSILQDHLKVLSFHIDAFSAAKEEVTRSWVDQEVVKAILNRHNIDIEHFVSYYASGVFDYFVQVILGNRELGSCPVMEEFLSYLKDRNLRADELFILCSHFKKSMIDVTYEHDMNTQKIFAAISYLFDSNFSGVLRLYTDTIYQKEQVIAQSLTLLNEYKNAIDASAIVAKTDTAGIITYANDNFCNLCGYTKDELIGANHNIVRHEETSSEFFTDMWSAIKSDRIFQGTIKNRKKDGTPYYVDITIVPLSDPMQGIMEYISIGYDVTKLVLAREEAFEASKAKESFLSAMSHEIRTPLNAILGFVAILEEQTHSELYAHYLEIISHSGKHLLHLINDILDFSKLQNSQITITKQPFDTRKTFGHLIELFAQSAYEKNLHLESFLSPDLPPFITADVMRIQQVISNLLSNAVKFTPKEGNVKISIGSEEQTLLIKVQDNGIGISAEAQNEIFKPFIQASNDHEGTGLGLAITTELIAAMNGEITLQSRENEGTCFTVNIPYETAQKETLKNLHTEEKKDRHHFQAHILVAEDNEDNLELISILLKRFGLTFQLVHNGPQAIEAFNKHQFDMVILDDEMPQMHGFEAAAAMRNYERESHKEKTPIIILSANATPQVKDRALANGCDYFLTKPIQIDKLQELFGRYLKQKVTGLDIQSLALQLELHEDELQHLLQIFEKNITPNLQSLKDAVAQKEYPQISKMAHKIKGSAANFGFAKVIALAEEMEMGAKAQNEIDYQRVLVQLLDAVNSLGFDSVTLS